MATTLKNVNVAIQEKYPFLLLVKADVGSYFYFICAGDEVRFSAEHNALGMLESTSVYVPCLNNLAVSDWVGEAEGLYELMVLESDELKQKIEDDLH